MAGLYYEHSGKFSLGGLLVGLIVGMGVAFPLAFIYAYVTLYNPFIYINFIATLGFGFLIGAGASFIMQGRKVRNGILAGLVGLLVGLVGYYFAWALWLYAFLRRNEVEDVSLLPLLIFPPAIVELMQRVNEVGPWRLRSWTPTGIALWVFWAAEAITVLVMSIKGAMSGIVAYAFCETCTLWCQAEANVVRVAGSDSDEMKRRLEAKDFGYLEKLGPAGADTLAWFQLDLDTCPTCRGTNTLTVKTVTAKLEKGKRSEESKELVDKLLVTSDEVEAVRRLGQKFAPPATPAA